MQNMDHIPREDFDNCSLATSKLRDQRGDPIGVGLFAKKDLIHRRGGTYICIYQGEIVPTKVATRPDYESRYVLQWGKNSIDASDFYSCFGRFSNDPIVKSKVNAELVRHEDGTPQHPIFKLVTKNKTIKKSDEIYVAYGDSYWKHHEVFEALSGELQHILTNRNASIKKWVEANYWKQDDIPDV
jgi:hypothetical protein